MSVQDFVDELRALGHESKVEADGKVSFSYKIPVGKFIGKEVRMGFLVPSDFRLTPPGGPHISPRLLPLKSGGSHPDGQVHASPTFGDDWEYWSRPLREWANTDRTVRTYMAHVRHLFETQ